MIAALVAVAITVPGIAAVDSQGQVKLWRAETGRWTSIYRCRQAPVAATRLAWAGSVLFIACPGEVMASWEIGEAGARPVDNQALSERRPALLGSGVRALFFAEAGAVWRYRPALDLLERLTAAPAWPLTAIGQTAIGLIAEQRDRRWHWRRGAWRLLTGT